MEEKNAAMDELSCKEAPMSAGEKDVPMSEEKNKNASMPEGKKPSYLKQLPKRYFITAFSGMAQGLFVTLIAGTILAQIAGWCGENPFATVLGSIATIAKNLMGVGIGVGIAHALGHKKLVVYSAGVAGYIGAFADKLVLTLLGQGSFAFGAGVGNPIGAYVVTMFCVEIANTYAGKTKLDIILIPLGMMLLSLAGLWIAYPFIWLVNQLGVLISFATSAQPFLMGVIISVLMGILLTMPTSSAAIWVAVCASAAADEYGLLLAGGAATVGCACHMVGFAVTSFRENGVGGLISQGIGTSMLQIPNIMKKPQIMLPEIVASAICGPLATCVFGLLCDKAGGGMGTSGLVGVFSTITTSLANGNNVALTVVGTILLMVVLPAAISLLCSELMRKKGWIRLGDMKLGD